jgi:hypothetical protein
MFMQKMERNPSLLNIKVWPWKLFMGPRGASHCCIFKQAPCGALFRSDLAWSGQQDDTYSFLIPTHLRNSRCSHCGLRYGSTQELKHNLLGLMVLDLVSIVLEV